MDNSVLITADPLVQLQQTLYASKNPSRRWLHCARRDWISSAVRKYARNGDRALEIGPGSGVYVPVLKEVFGEVCLADLESTYLAAIKERYERDQSMTFVADDITASKLPSAHFDLVLCTEVLEHIADSQAALRNIARIMKDSGVLVLSTPQRYSSLELTAKLALSRPLIWLTRKVYREPVLELGHINLMTDRELETQLHKAGLRIVERYKGGLYLPVIAELFGEQGQKLSAFLERKIRGGMFDGVLWTQYYIATRITSVADTNADSNSRLG